MKKITTRQLVEYPKFLYHLLQRKNFWIILSIDILLIILAHTCAYLIRFDFEITYQISQIISLVPLLILIKIPVFFSLGLYRGMWRFTSIEDLFNIAKATALSSSIIILSVLYLNRFSGFSRSVFLMDAVFTFIFICTHRGTIRYLLQTREFSKMLHGKAGSVRKRLLLIGAGSAAEKVVREIRDNENVHYRVVGLVDDDKQKLNMKIHNIEIVGSIDDLQEAIYRTRAEELLITVTSASAEQMKRIVNLCQKSELPYKVLPSLGEIISGQLTVSSIREIAYSDLLGRPSINLDQKEIGKYLTTQSVIVTGAGGSIGSELCRQIIKFKPEQLILLDAGEENLYKIQMELQHEHGYENCVAILGKIQNRDLLNSIFCEYAPSVVFHAAAYKHVPLVESNPWEAVFNNVFAVRNVIETSIYHKADRFVLVSTDKAVRPTSVMGASKRLTELLMLAYCQERWCQSDCQNGYKQKLNKCPSGKNASSCNNNHNTKFMAVRFGNVLGSSGSVIPLFERQIKQGGPVTVTHPEMTRYFMSIPEAAQLILQAGAMGTGGEIFILKMGDPIKIQNMARDLIRLMGKQPDTEIQITFTGLRPGEKMFEELITVGEGIVSTSHEKIMMLRGDGVNYNVLEKELSILAQNAKSHDAIGIRGTLSNIIPEYTPANDTQSVINNFSNLIN